jgi:hypothetical protein
MHAVYYSSDTAVLDLMTLHFLKGHFWFYYWGETYYGILDSILLMPLFRMWGCHPWVSQLIPLVFTPVFLLLYHRYIAAITRKSWIAHLATLWLAVGNPYVLRFTFGTYNYIFGLIFGMGHFLLAQRLFIAKKSDARTMVGLGLLAGFSWYYFRFILFFWLAIFISLWWNALGPEHLSRLNRWWRSASWRTHWRRIVDLEGQPLSPGLRKTLGVINYLNVINALFVVFLWLHGNWVVITSQVTMKFFFWATAKISIQVGLGVFAVAHWRTIRSQGMDLWKKKIVRCLSYGFILGYLPSIIASLCGHAPGSPGKFVALPIIRKNVGIIFHEIFPLMLSYGQNNAWKMLTASVAITGILMVSWRLYRVWRERAAGSQMPFMLSLFAINLFLCLFCNELGDQFSGRYLFPFYLAIPLGIAWVVESLPRMGKVIAAVLLLGCFTQAVKVDDAQSQFTDVPRYEALERVLTAQGIQGGYADYWVAYKMTAIANERIIIAPIGDNDRYRPYRDKVKALENIVLISEPLDPSVHKIAIVGQNYTVLRQVPVEGLLVTYLEVVPGK